MPDEKVTVWDTEAGEVLEVSRDEAAAGVLRFARSLGPGTPACGEYEMKANRLAGGDDA